MLPDRRRRRLPPNESAAPGRVVGDSILFKSDFSRAQAAEGLRTSFGSCLRSLRTLAATLKQVSMPQVRSASDRELFSITSGEGQSLVQRATQRAARFLVAHTRSRLPLHTIQFTAIKSILSGSCVETALALSSARFPAVSPNLSWPFSQERLQSQCQKS